MKRHPYRIVLADDHTIVRQGIKRMIEEKADLRVVGEASDGLELLSLLKTLDTDLVIVDISMPKLRGIEATCEIKKNSPHVKVMILTMYKDKELLRQAISSGADGYILKESSDKELHFAIKKIRQGEMYICPGLAGVADKLAQTGRKIFKPRPELLTRREREVLSLIAEGKSNKEIANLLFISIRTAQNHRFNIMNKLRLKKTADLIRYAIHQGYTA